jgi:hypothetical protein
MIENSVTEPRTQKGSLLATIEEAEEFVQSEADPTARMLPNA